MNVTFDLPPAAVSRAKEEAAQKGITLEQQMQQIALHWVAESSGDNGEKSAQEKSPQDRAMEWREWVANHQAGSVIADDSRESIYAGRGE